MNFLKQVSENIWIQGLITSGIILTIIFGIGFLLLIFKPSKNRKSIKYIYSFAAGFILITAIVGQFVEAREKLLNFYESKQNHFISDAAESFVSLAIIIAGILIAALIVFLIHKIYRKFNHHRDHSQVHLHSHELDHNYDLLMHGHSKIPGIIILTSHRFPAGLAIGGLLYNANYLGSEYSMLALIAFIIHIIPELLIVYFGLLDSGKSRKETFGYASLAKIAIIPGIFLGLAFGEITTFASMFWFQPLIFIIVGSLLVWGVIIELAPEFIHHRQSSKIISAMSFVFMLGVALSLFIQFIHSH